MNKANREKLKKMLKEKRFEDIYRVFGEKVYNRYFEYFIVNDVKYECGDMKKAKRIISFTPKKIERSIITFVMSIVLGKAAIFTFVKETLENESKKAYKELIQEYDEKTIEYISNLNLEGYDDIDVFMKLFDDMGQSMYYDEPEINAIGYMRVDAMLGKGVCRNMADDIAYKLNLINPKYNAKTVEVKIPEGVAAAKANVIWKEKEVIEEDENVSDNTLNNSNNRGANHRVVFVDLPERNLTLVLDPTNSSIGYLHDGKIDLINVINEKHYKYCYFDNSLIEGEINNAHVLFDLYKSEFVHESEELDKEFGVEAQNKSLEKVRSMNK